MEAKIMVIADIVDNVRRVFQILNEKSKQVEKQTGLTSPQLWAIKLMAEHPTLRVSDLARRMYLHPATVVGILDRLEARGLARRSGCEKDRRVVWVELTALGKNLVDEAPEVVQGHLVSGLSDLSPAGLADINRGLKKLIKVFGAQKTPMRLSLTPEVSIPGKKGKSKGKQGS